MIAARSLRAFELATRPIHPHSRVALDKRWADLPEHVKTDNQLLGRCAVGCEGTHGVFPKCDLTCSPCYHSADANKVRIDGGHTLSEVHEQLEFLHQVRGPRARVISRLADRRGLGCIRGGERRAAHRRRLPQPALSRAGAPSTQKWSLPDAFQQPQLRIRRISAG